MNRPTTDFNASDYMQTKEDVIAYIDALLEENDPAFFMACLRDIAKSHGMTALAQEAGLSRQGLYKALSENGQPLFSTVTEILRALGFRLSVKPLETA
ncbi:addiction module antidote protein [Ponticaulis profundi]|uniref:Addiction module antidote protein n=1 Tax=Ponticaulis profundi TaxID=2665222 RepID=A0ABW1S6D9_9PROT